jgi:cell division protein ZapA (FtsZ GTPase activity inhibitor)
MSEHISIKVNIADTVFPLKVKMEAEEHIRKAVDLINNKLISYTNQFGLKDKSSALSMCALELTSEFLSADTQKDLEINRLEQKIAEIEQMLENI